MMDDWDAEDFEPAAIQVKRPQEWEGEDEEGGLKDNWDEEDEERTEEAAEGAAVQVKKKKPLKDRLADKERKRKSELEERKRLEEEASREMSPTEKAAEKLRLQKIQEDADLELARDALGLNNDSEEAVELDKLDPSTLADFNDFRKALSEKILKYEKSPHYVTFLESLYRQLASSLEAEDLKKLGTTLNALANEKVKLSKAKAKKSRGKAKLNTAKQSGVDIFDDAGFAEEYDDFI